MAKWEKEGKSSDMKLKSMIQSISDGKKGDLQKQVFLAVSGTQAMTSSLVCYRLNPPLRRWLGVQRTCVQRAEGVFPGIIVRINKKQIICPTQHILKIIGWRLRDMGSVNVILFQRCVLGILLFEGERE